jgi:ElaB/YqjD/DUF883 family membrane-anchored ribosome-binding protein
MAGQGAHAGTTVPLVHAEVISDRPDLSKRSLHWRLSMDTRSIMAPLNAAAASLSAIARNLGARGAQLRDSFHADQVRRQLLSAAEDLSDAATEAAQSARKAATPYAREIAESAHQQMVSLRDGVASGARALARQAKKPNVVSRHPYASAIVVVGACFVALRAWRRRHPAAQAAKPRASAARKSTNGAVRSPARKRASSTGKATATPVH